MPTICSVLVCLVFIVSGSGPAWAKTTQKKTPKTAKSAQQSKSLKDLETATVDLQENTKDLRRNITNWRKIQKDGQLTSAEKKNWRDKANTYLQECEAYEDALGKIDPQKLPKSEVSNHFLAARKDFQRELHYLRETLQGP
jgi:hypothetical protein